MHTFLQILPNFDWLCLVYIRGKFYDWGSEVSGLSISNIKISVEELTCWYHDTDRQGSMTLSPHREFFSYFVKNA